MQKTSAPLATTCWGLERDGQAHLCGDGEFRPMGARAEQDDYTHATHARDDACLSMEGHIAMMPPGTAFFGRS